MTLSIVWKSRNSVRMAADTCVSVRGCYMPYRGIKVLEVPVKVVDVSWSNFPEIYSAHGAYCSQEVSQAL